jgi:protein O-GlcNAc transferase
MQRFSDAARLHAEGKLDQARRIYVRILEREPRHFGALNNLGILAFCARDLGLAQTMLERATTHPEHSATSHGVLAATLLLRGHTDRAQEELNEAFRLDPRCAEPFYFVGLALKEKGAVADAIRCLEMALRLAPDHANARNDLGVAYLHAGELAEARGCFEKVGGALGLANLAQVCRAGGRWDEGVRHLREAIALAPGDARLWSNLACFLQEANRAVEALECGERAVALGPDLAEAHIALGNALCRLGRHADAARAYDRAGNLPPAGREFEQNLLFMRHYCGGIGPRQHAAQHRRWIDRFIPDGSPRQHTNSRDPGRKLRVGYVSADLRAHPVAYFLAPVLEAHDPAQVEAICYNSGPEDSWTERIGRAAAVRRAGSDAELERQIFADRIDILVDLSGHTPGNRLSVFARKPAPVQVTWLGYMSTTGLAAIDYILVDPQLAPPGEEAPFVEEPLRIPGCWFAWERLPVKPTPAPCLQRGHVTYGCFGKLAKAGLPVIEAWAEILKGNPTSRLMMKNKAFADEAARDQYRGYFERLGVTADRVELAGPSCYEDYLRELEGVDIVLDTFPYSGGTTTCEALSMGVPVITLRGERFAGRLGTTVLHNAGLNELIAETTAEYIRKAVDLGRNPERIAKLRSGMRAQLAGSTLCDVAGFTRKLEGAYRQIWARWCNATLP